MQKGEFPFLEFQDPD